MRLYLVRHGASTGNTPGNLLGQGDYPLSPLGVAQARAVAARLAPLGPMPVFCSDLTRARVTAERIARVWSVRGGDLLDAALGVPPPVNADPRLREIDLGEYEGRDWEEFEADEGLRAAFADEPFSTGLPGGESLADLQERVLAAVGEIVGAEVSASGDGAVCMVSHDGPIRAIVNHYLGVPADRWWVLTTAHGGLSLLEWSDDWVNVRFVNDTSHIAGAADVVDAGDG